MLRLLVDPLCARSSLWFFHSWARPWPWFQILLPSSLDLAAGSLAPLSSFKDSALVLTRRFMATIQNSDSWRLSRESANNIWLASLGRRIFSLEAAGQHAHYDPHMALNQGILKSEWRVKKLLLYWWCKYSYIDIFLPQSKGASWKSCVHPDCTPTLQRGNSLQGCGSVGYQAPVVATLVFLILSPHLLLSSSTYWI